MTVLTVLTVLTALTVLTVLTVLPCLRDSDEVVLEVRGTGLRGHPPCLAPPCVAPPCLALPVNVHTPVSLHVPVLVSARDDAHFRPCHDLCPCSCLWCWANIDVYVLDLLLVFAQQHVPRGRTSFVFVLLPFSSDLRIDCGLVS